MLPSGNILFISDLHLDESSPKITALFCQFLEVCAQKKIAALYILGDLFEAWIGDDDLTAHHQLIISALKNVTENLPVYFIHGNRDFLIGKRFLQATGCQLLSDEQTIELYGEKILLMHGDSLCIHDEAYGRWRKISRSPLLNRVFFLLWPLTFRRWFANKMREKSRQHTTTTQMAIMDVVQSAVIDAMRKHQVDILIHGHTHRPDIHEFADLDCVKKRIVLGAWHEHGNYLCCDSSLNKKLVDFVMSDL